MDLDPQQYPGTVDELNIQIWDPNYAKQLEVFKDSGDE